MNGVNVPPGLKLSAMSPVSALRVYDAPFGSGSVAGSIGGTAPATTLSTS